MRAWPGVPLAGIAPIVRGAVDAGRFAPLHFLRTGSPSHQRRLFALLLSDRRKGGCKSVKLYLEWLDATEHWDWKS